MTPLAMRCLLLVLLLAASAASGQQANKVWRIGVLTITAPAAAVATPFDAFLREMRALGYREGENLLLEWRHTGADPQRRREEAGRLMAWKPDVVFTVSGVNAVALRDANPAVPVVVGAAGDLVGMGLAATLARPGGNVTGLQILSPDLAAKRLQLLKELMPKLQRVAVLHAPAEEDAGFYHRLVTDLQSAAAALAVEVFGVQARSGTDLERAFAEMKSSRVGAALVISSPFMVAHRQRVVALATQQRILTMYELAADAEAGGVIAYGPKVDAMFRRGAGYVDRILKGAKAAEMPIEQPTQFDLVINRRSAAALGLKIPASMLVRAERVID